MIMQIENKDSYKIEDHSDHLNISNIELLAQDEYPIVPENMEKMAKERDKIDLQNQCY